MVVNYANVNPEYRSPYMTLVGNGASATGTAFCAIELTTAVTRFDFSLDVPIPSG